ncbi:hypothetical protein C5167_008540 [Papaver somniferum]|uniref:Uncharacterized protein n=1 Tax=Papaver somniferum TaxID=3469 RepID=A0A4Y7JYR8_PAPSO|nr:hypothetical protein C5167_008540 [Papaver somniferum]
MLQMHVGSSRRMESRRQEFRISLSICFFTIGSSAWSRYFWCGTRGPSEHGISKSRSKLQWIVTWKTWMDYDEFGDLTREVTSTGKVFNPIKATGQNPVAKLARLIKHMQDAQNEFRDEIQHP